MNKRDREFMDSLDGVLGILAILTPSNPADLKAIIHNHRLAVAAAKDAHYAVGLYRSGEVAWAMDELAKATAALSDEPEPDRWSTPTQPTTAQPARDEKETT